MQPGTVANVSIEGDQQVGRRFLPAARRMLGRLQEVLKNGRVESGGLHGPLSDDVYCYVRVAMRVATIHIVADPLAPEFLDVPPAERIIAPDFLSGTVRTGYITEVLSEDGRTLEGRLDAFMPTPQCAELFELGNGFQPSKRLAVKPYQTYDELANPEPPPVYSQYTRLKPTLYSGTMAKLVQFLMGYGKIDPKKSVYKRRLVPEKADRFVEPETKFQKDTRRHGVQIRYDWRFNRTHGLTRAIDGKWWVVQIAAGKGIHAMPLKVYPETATAEFRAKVEDMSDAAGLAVLDLFDAFPTGESLPTVQEELDAKVRAGMVVRAATAADVQPFYNSIPYSPWMGWAFSESGHEAHNTAYYYHDDGVQRGVHFACALSIGETEEFEPYGRANALKRYIAGVAKEYPLRSEAAFFKIDRLGASDIASYFRMRPADAWEAIDALVMDPIAPVVANCRKVGEGKIYWNALIGPQIKFYNPAIGYLVSHDMRPAHRIENRPLCDTVMHVFFRGQELKYVKYYLGPSNPDGGSESDFEECMYVGSWSSRTWTGDYGVPPMFYTSDIDDRQEIFSVESLTVVTSRDIGYTTVSFGDDPVRPYLCGLSRTKSFLRKTVSTHYDSRSYASAVCVPEGCREAYYYAKRDLYHGKSSITTFSYTSLGDPNVYTGWRNLPGFTGFLPMGCTVSACYIRAEHPAGCGKVDDRRVWFAEYSPYACSEFADSGPWASTCQQIEAMVYSVPLTPIPAIIVPAEHEAELVVSVVSSSPLTPLEVRRQSRTGENAPFLGIRWFRPSPDPVGGFMDSIAMRQNVLGEATVLVHATDINVGMDAIAGTPNDPVLRGINSTFVGVING